MAHVIFQGWLAGNNITNGCDVRIVREPGMSEKLYFEQCQEVGPDAMGVRHTIWIRLKLDPSEENRVLKLYLESLGWPISEVVPQ